MRSAARIIALILVGLTNAMDLAAQEPQAAARKPQALAIPIPAGAVVQWEMDAREDDLLKVVKSLLAGLTQQSAAQAKGTSGTAPAAAAPSTGAKPAKPATLADWLSDKRLGALLNDIHHLRVVAFTLPPDQTKQAQGSAPSADVLTFYEEPFRSKGGGGSSGRTRNRRRLLMVGSTTPGASPRSCAPQDRRSWCAPTATRIWRWWGPSSGSLPGRKV